MDMNQKLKKLKWMTWLMIIAMAAVPLINKLEGDPSEPWHMMLLFIGCIMSILYPTIQSLYERIQQLETQVMQLKNKSQQSE